MMRTNLRSLLFHGALATTTIAALAACGGKQSLGVLGDTNGGAGGQGGVGGGAAAGTGGHGGIAGMGGEDFALGPDESRQRANVCRGGW
jgi:hypothetical protein